MINKKESKLNCLNRHFCINDQYTQLLTMIIIWSGEIWQPRVFCAPTLSVFPVSRDNNNRRSFYLYLKICCTPTLCAYAFINVHVSVCMYFCVYVCVLLCVCIFRETERVGVDNQEQGYISLLHNEPLLCSGDMMSPTSDTFTYIDALHEHTCYQSKICWFENWDKLCPQSKTAF